MGTVAQNEANRKSAGPKTENGKSVASKNAITHGLTSTHVVIRGEDQGEFEELRKNLEEEIEPVGVQEFDLVETIAICMWRRRRIYRMETGPSCRWNGAKPLPANSPPWSANSVICCPSVT